MLHKKLINWYLSRDSLPYWCVLVGDLLIVMVSGVVAFASYYGPGNTLVHIVPLLLTLMACIPCYLVGFRLQHTYSGIIRKSSFADLARITVAIAIGIALVMLIRIYCPFNEFVAQVRFRVLALQAVLSIMFMCGMRVAIKMFYDYYIKKHMGIYGLDSNKLLDIEMKDLLPREPIVVDTGLIMNQMKGKCIMVTGAAGSIGSQLAKILTQFNPSQLVLIDQAETPLHDVRMWMKENHPELKVLTIVSSICHSHRMEKIFAQTHPVIIFHAAAYKHVPMMEDNPVESILNNVDGTRKIADLAVKYGAERFIMVSTDKAVNPTNVMGCSKRICEIYCQSLSGKTQFITTRFGNVLGSNGSVIPIFREQIRQGGPVKVTHPDIRRFFMLIPEACMLVLEAATIGKGGQILVFDMGKPVRIIDLAKRMISLSGHTDVEIEISGLRPGEKLYEEVLNDEEKVLPTQHRKIKCAKVREYEKSEVEAKINRLIEVARTYDEEQTVRLMKDIVPEYVSQNSKYCAFDK